MNTPVSENALPETTVSVANQPVASISPHAAFSHLFIAAIFLFVGLVIGYSAYERVDQHANIASSELRDADNQALIEQAVGTAVAAVSQGVSGGNPDPNTRYTVDSAGNPTRGPEDAAITMIEFADFRCGYCKRFNDETIEPLMEQFDGSLRIVFRDYPVLGPESQLAALAAECADDQGMFWEFHDMLYAAPDQLNRAAFMNYTTALEMDISTFTTCYDGELHRDEIIQDYIAGQNLGVTGTPTFFINGKILIGAQPLDTFILMIEIELAEIENAAAES